MHRYRLHLADGSDIGEATYAVLIRPDEEILVGNGRRGARGRIGLLLMARLEF